jgi:hypothetical protein
MRSALGFAHRGAVSLPPNTYPVNATKGEQKRSPSQIATPNDLDAEDRPIGDRYLW